MKHLSLLIVAFIISNIVYGQFEQGDIDISGGIGLGLYGASGNDDNDSTTGVQAACVILNLSSNYSVTDDLLLGLNLERNGYAVSDDSSNENSYVRSLNARLNIGYRLVNSEKHSFSVVGQIGYTGLKFGDKKTSEKVTSGGVGYGFGFDWQNMTSEKVGIFFKGGWYTYVHSKFTDQDGEIWQTSNNNTNIKVNFHGVNLSAGLVFKI